MCGRMDFDVIVRNGKVIDGSGNGWYNADIGIKDEKIERISRTILNKGNRIIDAKGLVVCPGFINVHSHSDRTILAHNNAENCVTMGLTTELVGTCGSSIAPITKDYRSILIERKKLQAWSSLDEEIDWLSLDDFRSRLMKKGIGINIAPLVGHGSVRSMVLGEEGKGGEKVTPTAQKIEEMKAIVDSAMEQGAFGLSTGLTYAPGRNALTKEIIELAKAVSKYGGVYSSHMRCEGDCLIEATNEFIQICEESGIRGTIAHHKAMGLNNYGKVCETLRLVEKARKRGVDIIIDLYPWQYGGTNKSLGARYLSFDPESSLIRNRSELIQKLIDPDEWETVKCEFEKRRQKELDTHKIRERQITEEGGWTSTPFFASTTGTVLSSTSHPKLNGISFRELCDFYKVNNIQEAWRQLLLDDDGYTATGAEPYSEDDIKTIMKYPWTTISTDQYALDVSKTPPKVMSDYLTHQNPRGTGTYSKILGKYVREKKVLTLEDAIRKMTSLPANFLNLQNRGLIKEKFWADLVIFNKDTVKSRATYGDPYAKSEGIMYVLVNGHITVDKGNTTGTLGGKTLIYT
jgi:N-acyl-D-amino-acid deacylase